MDSVAKHYIEGEQRTESERFRQRKDVAFTVNVQNFTSLDVIQNIKIIIESDILVYFLIAVVWGPGLCINVLGIILNILNIVTFFLQGVNNSVNTSLLWLTTSDLGSLVFVLLAGLCRVPGIDNLDLPFNAEDLSNFCYFGHLIFTRVSTGTTAWIAMERCLCIVIPLKVKSLITSRRAVVYSVFQYFFWIGACLPWFYTTRLNWMFDSARNKSIFRLFKIANKDKFEGVVFVTNNVLPLMFCFLIAACTVVLSKALLRNVKWRTRSVTQTGMSRNRDARVVKLVLIISLVYIVCYTPGALFYVLAFLDPEIRLGGKQDNFRTVFVAFQILLENINATANFFIYMKMSSKFNSTFRQFICLYKI